jgi:hypothetical protein
MKFELYFKSDYDNILPNVILQDAVKPDVFYKELLFCNCNDDVFIEKNKENNKEINDYLLKSIDFRINNLKNIDMIFILNFYKQYINSDDIDISTLQIGIIRKTENINKRIKNNYTKLFKLYDDYRYYRNHLTTEIKEKGQTKKLNKVKEKMHEYFTNEIKSTENRIEFLSEKLSILKYHNANSGADDDYIKRYITDFIDKDINVDNDIRNILNDILLYNYGNNGKYYENLKIPKKCKTCKNTKTICEINALIYG